MTRRSCRRFKQDPVPREHLNRMMDAARYVPTGYNKPGLRFAIVASPDKVAGMCQFAGWLTGKPPTGGDGNTTSRTVFTILNTM